MVVFRNSNFKKQLQKLSNGYKIQAQINGWE